MTNVTWDGAQWRVGSPLFCTDAAFGKPLLRQKLRVVAVRMHTLPHFLSIRTPILVRCTQVSLEPAELDVGVAPANQAKSANPPVTTAAAAPRSMDDIDADDDVPAVQEPVPAASWPADPASVSGAQHVIADRIWVAAGTRTDFKADPVLSQLRSTHPVHALPSPWARLVSFGRSCFLMLFARSILMLFRVCAGAVRRWVSSLGGRQYPSLAWASIVHDGESRNSSERRVSLLFVTACAHLSLTGVWSRVG